MEIVVFLQQWGALIIAAISLLVAIISLIKSSKAQKLQNKINKLELEIKKNEIEKIKSEKEEASNSCVEARVIKISDGKYKLKVWNSGNVTVRNVNLATDIKGILLLNDITPYEELEQNKSFEIPLIVYNGTPRKFKVTTSWENQEGQKLDKTQLVSF